MDKADWVVDLDHGCQTQFHVVEAQLSLLQQPCFSQNKNKSKSLGIEIQTRAI